MQTSKTSQSTKPTKNSTDTNDIIELEIAEIIDHDLLVNLITYDEYQDGEWI